MQKIAFPVIYRGLDWEGFSVTHDTNTLVVGEGVVGQIERPLPHGWRFSGATVALQPNDETVEVILYHNEVCLLVRSREPNEIFPEELNTLFLLAWKEDNEWVCHYPERDEYYGKDKEVWERSAHSARRLSFV